MNSRFKFRVWDKKHNEYIPSNMIGTLLYFGYRDEFHIEYKCFSTFADSLIIEQCTGLSDKNGNLIYEGDVVYDSVYENNFVVSWDNDRTGYVLSANNTNHIDYLSKILIERHNLKIIGNVHEQVEQKD